VNKQRRRTLEVRHANQSRESQDGIRSNCPAADIRDLVEGWIEEKTSGPGGFDSSYRCREPNPGRKGAL
jgi:hypothetical protein